MHQNRLKYDSFKSPTRSITPYSNTSSNHESMNYDSEFRKHHGLASVRRLVGDDCSKQEKNFMYKTLSTNEENIASLLEALETDIPLNSKTLTTTFQLLFVV